MGAVREKASVEVQASRPLHAERFYPIILTLMFLGIGFVGMTHHELWRDEVHPWLFARWSDSLGQLVVNREYEGHPMLWYLILYVVSRFTHQIVAMQVVHLLLATAAVYILVRFSPFTKLQKFLFAFSYFPVYQYSIICRNYAVGMMLLFAFCAIFTWNRRQIVLLSVILLLLANASAIGWIMAASLGIVLLVAALSGDGLAASKKNWQLYAGVMIVLAGLAISVAYLLPPADSGVEKLSGFEAAHLVEALATFSGSHLLIPATFGPLGKFIPSQNVVIPLQAVVAVLLFCFLSLSLAKRRIAFLAYCLMALGLLFFNFAIYRMGPFRHGGHYVLALVASLWLAAAYPDKRLKSAFLDTLAAKFGKWIGGFLLALFAYQVLVGLIVGGWDYLRPYSNGKATAAFIESAHLQDMPMIADPGDQVSPVAAYLDREVYYPDDYRLGTFIIRSSRRKRPSADQLLECANRFIDSRHQAVLLILNYPLDEKSLRTRHVSLIRQFSGSIQDENYWLYKVSR